ncbi:MAG: TetR/AcrR family transcriptional regulator C-terminal domain-containing protein [Actinobacteria bacterium]|nr:TetR/AcrR family transcriptional regulator C-terminal domain-containing protein [Actinomycetota bacterium]
MSSPKKPPLVRAPLNRERVSLAAVRLADESGLDALSMRNLAQELGVVPMALYKHVANKEELFDEMINALVLEIDPLQKDLEWKPALRHRILSARTVLLRHPWAPHVIESRTSASPVVLDYMDTLIGIFLKAGFSLDLTHHAMHALGSRMWGFIQEVFPTPESPTDPEELAEAFAQWSIRYPNIIEMATAANHTDESQRTQGCDDQFEFEFALDLMLDGFERLHKSGWSSTQVSRSQNASLESAVRGKRK